MALLWILGLALVPTPGIGQAPDQADYRYNRGFAASGNFEGTCDSVGFRLLNDATTQLMLRSEGGTLTVIEIRENRTVVNPDDDVGYAILEPAWETNYTFPVAPGELRIDVHNGSHLHAKPSPWNGPLLQATLRGSQWESGSLQWNQTYGPFYPAIAGNALVHGTGWIQQGWHGWSRPLRTPGTPVDVGGNLQVRMDSVVVTAPDGVYALTPFYSAENVINLRPVGWKFTAVFTYAVLHLTNAQAVLPSEAVEVLCQALTWSGGGSVTFRGAHGRLSTPEGPRSFNQREFTLTGTLEFQEGVEERDVGGIRQGWVRGTAAGSFEGVGFDYARALTASHSPLSPAEVGLLALLLAVVGGVVSQFSRLVGLFFTRFDPTSAPRHPTRARLLGLVRERPGISLQEVRAATGFNKNSLRHHLRVLQVVGLLKFLRGRHSLHLFLKDQSMAEAQKMLPLVGDPPVKCLVELAGAAPLPRRRASRELMGRFGMTRVGAWKVIRRAVAQGVLRVERSTSGELLWPEAPPSAPDSAAREAPA